MDELSPLFHDIEFNERFRGYDVEEVDAYVDRVAKAAALVQGRIAELQDRVAAAEAQPRTVVAPATPAAPTGDIDDARLSRVLILAQRTADAAIEEAKAEAESMREAASSEAERIRREADDHASLVLAEAETDRRQMITEAEEAAAAAVGAERARAAAEVAELERHRAFLADDIAILEQHLAETRLSVAASLSALTDLLEAPESFRAPAMPATSGVQLPAGLIEDQAGVATPMAGAVEEIAVVDEVPVIDEVPVVDEVDTDVAAEIDLTPAVDGSATALDDAPIENPAPPPSVAEVETAVPAFDEPFEPVAFASEREAAPTDELLTLDPSEPTEVFEAITVEPEPEPAPAEPVADVAPVEADLEVAEPVVLEPEVSAVPVDHPAPAVEPADDNRVFDIDLLDTADHEPVVDLTEPAVDLAEPTDEPSGELHHGVPGPAERPDADAATATAPPRLVTAEDIETAEPTDAEAAGEWIDELRDAASPDSATDPADLLFAPPDTEPVDNDHFLDQLRDAVGNDEPEEFAEDALAAFFDDGDDTDGRGWFNRRR